MISAERRLFTQLKSWLNSVEIPFEEHPAYILVTKNNSDKVPIYFNGKDLPKNAIVIQKEDLVNRKIQNSFDFFKDLQVQLGYQPRLPVDRGDIPSQKSSDFDLVAFKHMDFRRSPNPTHKQFEKYENIINIASNKFAKNNYKLLTDAMLDVEDLQSYARVWAVNFIGLYEGNDEEENKKILMEYLKDQLSSLKSLLKKKIINQLVEANSPAISDFAVQSSTNIAINIITDDIISTKKKSKKSYKKTLEEKLGALDHDTMVTTLIDAANNDKINFDARIEASKRIHTHSISCESCKNLELPSIGHGDKRAFSFLRIKDQNGNVYSNVKEAADALDLYPSNIRAVLSGKYSHTDGFKFSYA